MVTITPLVLLSLLTFTAATASAQAGSTRPWSNGPLTWDDFNSRPQWGNQIAEIRWSFEEEVHQERRGDTLVRYRSIRCLLDQASSWVDPAYQNPTLLLYNQTTFDLGEICARRMGQQLLNRRLQGNTYQTAMILQSACDNRVDELAKETNMGRDSLAVAHWAWIAEQELASTPPRPGTGMVRGKWSYGMHVHLGYGQYQGGLSDRLSGHFNFGYGLDLGYRKIRFLASGILSGTRLKHPLPVEPQWAESERLGLAMLDLSLGFEVIDLPKWRITPSLGAGLNSLYTELEEDNGRAALEHSSWGIHYGLNAEYKLRKLLELANIPLLVGHPTFNETSLRLRLYGMHCRFGPGSAGFSLNAAIGFCWTFSTMRPK